MRKTLQILVLAFCFSIGVSWAQDPAFTQFYGAPLYLNPAFAGSAKCPRGVINFKDHWPGVKSNYVTYAASYDQFVDILGGGVGILLLHDRAGLGSITNTQASLQYSYQINLSRDVAARLGLQGTFGQNAFDWQSFLFGDRIDSRYGFIYPTQENIESLKTPKNYFDASAGLLVYSSNMYGGFSAHHINRPEQNYIKTTDGYAYRLPMKITGHFGMVIPLGNDPKMSNRYISPNIIYQSQGNFNYLNVGMYYGLDNYVFGAWYRGGIGIGDNTIMSDALTLLLGLQLPGFKVGYSYDITVNSLRGDTYGSHEVSVGMQFACRPKKKKFRAIKCPVF